jgi:hypothetical protein
VPADQNDERQQDKGSCDSTNSAEKTLARPCSGCHCHSYSGVRNAASLAFSSGDIGSLTATRT